MAVPLVKHAVIIQYKQSKFPGSSAVFAGMDGVYMSAEHVHDSAQEIPVKGCVDFAIYNAGSAKVYLFDRAIIILPGQTWFPQKSSPLPLINQPRLTFEGDYQLSRSAADLITTAVTP